MRQAAADAKRPAAGNGILGRLRQAAAIGKKVAGGNSILARVRQAAMIDSLDYLTPDALTILESAIEAEIAPLAEAFSTDDIPDIYYYTQRIPNWLGAFSPTSTI